MLEEQHSHQARGRQVPTWLWHPGFQCLQFSGLLERQKAQHLMPLPDSFSINLSNLFFFRLLTSVLLGANEFCNSLHALWKSNSCCFLLLLYLPSGNFCGFLLVLALWEVVNNSLSTFSVLFVIYRQLSSSPFSPAEKSYSIYSLLIQIHAIQSAV